MLLKKITRRPWFEPETFEFDGHEFTFTPTEAGELVCDVQDDAIIKRMLSLDPVAFVTHDASELAAEFGAPAVTLADEPPPRRRGRPRKTPPMLGPDATDPDTHDDEQED